MILDFLFPNRCLHCNRIIPGKEIVCEICMEQIHFTHLEFTSDSLLKERCLLLFPVENASALMLFEKESLSRKIIHQLKYGNREIIGKILAEWTFEKLDFGNSVPDLMVTIPLHKKKLRKRGYNQLHLFTETLSEKSGIAFDHDVLKRNFHSKAQAKKKKEDRQNTENLFSLQKPIENSHILLIDDVFTTGNTMASAVWEILKGKNNTVSILVMAMD
ncbi:MAG: double zinc ribbon domain-containing protein [Bergeyella sp.]